MEMTTTTTLAALDSLGSMGGLFSTTILYADRKSVV